MSNLQINWTDVERTMMAIFPDEYEMLTGSQIRDIEEKISNAQSPFIQKQNAGGMHMDFGAAVNVVAELMLVTSVATVWYNCVSPAKEEATYNNFLSSLPNMPELEAFIKALLTQELLRTLERMFDKIADALMYL